MKLLTEIFKKFIHSRRYYRTDEDVAFSDLPASARKKIMTETVQGAMEMQLALVRKYEKKFGK